MANGGLHDDAELEKHRHPHSIVRQEALPAGIRRVQNNPRPIGTTASCFLMVRVPAEAAWFLGKHQVASSTYVVIVGFETQRAWTHMRSRDIQSDRMGSSVSCGRNMYSAGSMNTSPCPRRSFFSFYSLVCRISASFLHKLRDRILDLLVGETCDTD
jgi:hypothetical protein